MTKFFFYPDFRQANKVEVYEATDRYSSGYVLVGAMGIKAAMELHPNWVWLTPENREKASKNFEGEIWHKTEKQENVQH